MQKIKTIKLFSSVSVIFLFTFLVFIDTCILNTQAQTDDTDCIICSQFVPECSSNEKLINQTCKQCAHCESVVFQATSSKPLTECQKCTFHFQCPPRNICTNNCCVLNPKREKPPVRIKPGCKKCTKNSQCSKGNICKENCCRSKTTKVLNKVLKSPTCKMACGSKCCKEGEQCITVDQCKDRKRPCHLPVLKYCDNRTPEPLKGRLNPS